MGFEFALLSLTLDKNQWSWKQKYEYCRMHYIKLAGISHKIYKDFDYSRLYGFATINPQLIVSPEYYIKDNIDSLVNFILDDIMNFNLENPRRDFANYPLINYYLIELPVWLKNAKTNRVEDVFINKYDYFKKEKYVMSFHKAMSLRARPQAIYFGLDMYIYENNSIHKNLYTNNPKGPEIAEEYLQRKKKRDQKSIWSR